MYYLRLNMLIGFKRMKVMLKKKKADSISHGKTTNKLKAIP